MSSDDMGLKIWQRLEGQRGGEQGGVRDWVSDKYGSLRASTWAQHSSSLGFRGQSAPAFHGHQRRQRCHCTTATHLGGCTFARCTPCLCHCYKQTKILIGCEHVSKYVTHLFERPDTSHTATTSTQQQSSQRLFMWHCNCAVNCVNQFQTYNALLVSAAGRQGIIKWQKVIFLLNTGTYSWFFWCPQLTTRAAN